MTASANEPVTPDLHEQRAASPVDDVQENLTDLVGAFFTLEDAGDPGAPPAVSP